MTSRSKKHSAIAGDTYGLESSDVRGFAALLHTKPYIRTIIPAIKRKKLASADKSER